MNNSRKRSRGDRETEVDKKMLESMTSFRKSTRCMLNGIFLPLANHLQIATCVQKKAAKEIIDIPFSLYFQPKNCRIDGTLVLFERQIRCFHFNENTSCFVRGVIVNSMVQFEIPSQIEWANISEPELPWYFNKNDFFHNFDPNTMNIIVEDTDAIVCQEQLIKDTIALIQEKGVLESCVITSNNNGNYYLISLRGSSVYSMCIITFDENQNGKFVLHPKLHRLAIRMREKPEYLLSFMSACLTVQPDSDHFRESLWKDVQQQTLLPDSTTEQLMLSKDLHPTLVSKWLGFLYSVLQFETMNRMYNIQIELLYSPITTQLFFGHHKKMIYYGYNSEPQIMFHGVRVPRPSLEQAVQNIKKVGFDVTFARHSQHGGGGIYVSPQIGCALEYTHKEPDMYNYLFVCLTLPGNVKYNGTPDQPMEPGQTSWMTLCPPNKIFCITTSGILPVACVKFKLQQ